MAEERRRRQIRTRPRVDPEKKERSFKDTNAERKTLQKQSANREKAAPKPDGFVKLVDGQLNVLAQISEIVPVGDFANVMLGPVQLQWVMNADMEALVDVDWDQLEDDEDLPKLLNKEQLAVWNRVRRAMRATMLPCEFTVAEDRETVERSVRQHNERQAAEKKKSS